MRSTPSLKSFPYVAFETDLMFNIRYVIPDYIFPQEYLNQSSFIAVYISAVKACEINTIDDDDDDDDNDNDDDCPFAPGSAPETLCASF